MAGNTKKTKKSTKTKNKKQQKYNADNEIIIGVTTKPKEVRVDNKKTTRTKSANSKKTNTSKNKKTRTSSSKTQEPTYRKKTNKKYKPRENQNLTKEQKIKKLNRKKVIISLLVLIGIIIAGVIYFLTTPMFNIANIEVTGNEKNSVETYISLTKIELNSTNIFAVTKIGLKNKIKENPYVEDVTITRKLPNTIIINVKERQVNYQAQYNDKYVYIDKQGYILEINEKKKDTTILIGLSSTNEAITEGNRLNNSDLEKLDTVLKIVNYCSYNSIDSKITSINVSNTSNYTLNFEEEGKIVYLGDSTKLNEKIINLKNILEKEKGNKGEIFITEDEIDRNRIYFKPSEKE